MSEQDHDDSAESLSDDALIDAMKSALRGDGPSTEKVGALAAMFDGSPGGPLDPTPRDLGGNVAGAAQTSSGVHLAWLGVGALLASVLLLFWLFSTSDPPPRGDDVVEVDDLQEGADANPAELSPQPDPQIQPEPEPQIQPEPEARPEPQTQPEPVPTNRAQARVPRPTRPASPAVSSSAQADVISEAVLIRRARALLESEPRRAEGVLAEHRRTFPRGVLAEERDALAIEVRLAVGDREGAQRALARFDREHPNSAHRERIRQALSRGVR